MLKFKIDENLPKEIAELLVKNGHDALTILDQSLGGKNDKSIISICQKEKRCLITLDLDFSDIRSYPPQQYSGIVVLRTADQSKSFVLNMFQRILPVFKEEPLKKMLWIIEPNQIRIRE